REGAELPEDVRGADDPPPDGFEQADAGRGARGSLHAAFSYPRRHGMYMGRRGGVRSCAKTAGTEDAQQLRVRAQEMPTEGSNMATRMDVAVVEVPISD